MSFLSDVFGGGGSSRDSSADAASKQQQQQQSTTSTAADNTGDNIDNNVSYWDNEGEGGKKEEQQQTQRVEVVQKPAEKSAQEQMQEHVASLDLTNGIDMEKVGEDMRNGDTKSFNEALSTAAGNAYTASMRQMSELVDAKISKITEQAVDQANTTMNSTLAVSQMQQQLSFTKDPDIEPIAKAALAQAMKQTDDVGAAIASVEKFFAKAATSITGVAQPPKNSSGNPQFPSDSNNNSGHTNHDAWLDVLTGKTN